MRKNFKGMMLLKARFADPNEEVVGGAPLVQKGEGTNKNEKGLGSEGYTGGGGVAVDSIETVQQSNKVSPDLIKNDVDKVLVHIRPQNNPLAMVLMRARSSKSKTQAFEYWQQDCLPVETTLKTAIAADSEDAVLDTQNNKMFSQYETVFFPEVNGFDGDKETPGNCLAAYVVKKDGNKLTVVPVNGKIEATPNSVMKFPAVAANAKVIRGGRAHNELDVQTAPYAAYPTKLIQYIQKYKAQVEQSTANAIAEKNVNFTLSDIEQDALFDMTRGISINCYIGTKSKIFDTNKQEVYFSGGIWGMAGKEFLYGKKSEGNKFTKEDFIDMMKESFVGNNGSKRKTIFAGSEFMARLSLLDLGNDVQVSVKKRFNLEFNEMKTNFGTFEVIYDETMDVIGKSECAFIVDEDFLRRKDYEGIKPTQMLDLRGSGQRDVDAKVITRAMAPYLQNPNVHMRVIPNPAG